MKNFLFLFMLLFQTQICYSEDTDIDVVYLKNGSIMKGKVIEQIIGQQVKLKSSDGSIFVFKADEIARIVKEKKEIADQIQVPGVSSQIGYKDPSKAFMLSFIPPIITPIQGLGQFYIGRTDEGLFYFLTGIFSWGLIYKYLKEGDWNEPYYDSQGYLTQEQNNNGLYAGLGAIWYVGQWIYSSYKARDDATKLNESLNVSLTPEGTVSIKLCHKF